jgi:hypothetical protein
MSDPTKIRGIAASTRKPNAAYKPTWERIFRKTAGNPPLQRMSMIFDRCAAPCRASLTSSSLRLNPQLWGAGAPLFLKKGETLTMNPTSTTMLFWIDRSHPLRK